MNNYVRCVVVQAMEMQMSICKHVVCSGSLHAVL